MKFDKNIVVGLKFYIGPMDLEGIPIRDFIEAVQFKFQIDDEDLVDSTGLYTGKNELKCEYYDEEEGLLYVHFDVPVPPEDLLFFEEEEMIYKKVEE